MCVCSRPIPRHELVEPAGGVACYAVWDIGDPGLRIDVIHFGTEDQAVHDGGALAAAVGAGEEPRFAAESDAAQGPFGVSLRRGPPCGVESLA